MGVNGRKAFSARTVMSVLVVLGMLGLPAVAAAAPVDEPSRTAVDLAPLVSEERPAETLEPLVAMDPEGVPSPSRGKQPGEGFDAQRSVRDDELTDPFNEVFQNPDGSRTVSASPVPERFRDLTGAWTEYDLSLVQDKDKAGFRAKTSDRGLTILELTRSCGHGVLVDHATRAAA